MKLNFGCGYNIREGYINIDKYNPNAVNLDLNNSLPYKDNSVSEILMFDILEHLNNPIEVLKECHRVIKPKGIIKIKIPHFSSYRAFDIFHKTQGCSSTFDRFTRIIEKGTYEDKDWFNINKVKIHFFKGLMFYNYLIEFLVNLNNKTREIYESQFAWMFPAKYIEVELEVNKNGKNIKN